VLIFLLKRIFWALVLLWAITLITFYKWRSRENATEY